MQKYIYTFFFFFLMVAGVQAQGLCTGEPNSGSVQAQDSTLCNGDSVFLSLTGLTETGLMFQWESSPNGVTYTGIGGAIDSVYSEPVTADIWYHCVVTCVSSGLTNTTAGKRIYVDDMPPAGGIITETHTGGTYSFVVDGLSGTYTYQWNFGDGDSSVCATPNHTFATSGVYTVTVIVTNGCGADTLQKVTNVVASVNQRGGTYSISVYPKPVRDGFYLVSDNTRLVDKIKLVDMYGRVCWQNSAPLALPLYVPVNTFQPVAGIYLLELEAGKQHVFLRLVME